MLVICTLLIIKKTERNNFICILIKVLNLSNMKEENIHKWFLFYKFERV